MEERYCLECMTTYGIENHHIILKKKCKPLEDCPQNQVDLCSNHHRGTYGVHGKNGHALNLKYKLRFQNYLEQHLLKEYLTREEIKEVLEISEKPLDRLLKRLTMHKGKYAREDVILKCMADKKVTEEEIMELDK